MVEMTADRASSDALSKPTNSLRSADQGRDPLHLSSHHLLPTIATPPQLPGLLPETPQPLTTASICLVEEGWPEMRRLH